MAGERKEIAESDAICHGWRVTVKGNLDLFSSTPFVVISGGGPGRTLENVTARADAYGAVRILYKPFEDEELLAALNQTLGLQ